jgi:hypothetical protein
MQEPGYIFIVGMPRTGTTLTRHILNRSKDICIGGESRFFEGTRRFGFETRPSFRNQIAQVGDISTDVGAGKVVDYIYSIHKNNFWGRIAKSVEREEFLCKLLASDRSERSFLDLAMEFYANGKPLRGEKTPAHIYCVPTLFEWFPNTKIIHMFRDPRAIYVSQQKKHQESDSLLMSSIMRQVRLVLEFLESTYVIIAWLRIIRLHHQYQQRYPKRYYLLKYEDLISDPRTTSQKLCEFLEVDFIEEMLQQTVINSSFLSSNQVQGFDTQAIDRWRKYMHPIIQKWFALWSKKHLLQLGYKLALACGVIASVSEYF